MKRIPAVPLFISSITFFLIHCYAEELSVPQVPSSAVQWMPEEPEQFSDAAASVLRKLIPALQSEIPAALATAFSVYACILFVSLLSRTESGYSPADLAGAVCISTLLLQQSNTMFSLATNTVAEICEYEKLFLPVITAAAASQGAVTSASALYVGISVFTAFLSNLIKRILFPGIYMFLALAIAHCAIGDQALKQIKDQLQKGTVWALKTSLTVYFSYISFSRIVTGTADKSALKAAKATISTIVPVIGSSLSQASEALLSGAEMIKNSIGIYGVFAFTAMMVTPFYKIGIQYLVLKITSAVCNVIGTKRLSALVNDYASALGFLLAIAGTTCVFMMIGTVSFMRIL